MTKRKVLFDTIIFVSALVLRMLFMLIIAKNNPALFFGGDSKNYCELANNLLARYVYHR